MRRRTFLAAALAAVAAACAPRRAPEVVSVDPRVAEDELVGQDTSGVWGIWRRLDGTTYGARIPPG